MWVTLPTFGSGSGVSSGPNARYRWVQSAMPGYFHNSESTVPEQQQRPVNNRGLDVQNCAMQVMLSKNIPQDIKQTFPFINVMLVFLLSMINGGLTASDTLMGGNLGEKWEVAQYSSFENCGFWPVVDFDQSVFSSLSLARVRAFWLQMATKWLCFS